MRCPSIPLVLFISVLGFTVAACAQGPSVPPLEDRATAQVASTTAFTFYSHFWLNQHDYLYLLALLGRQRLQAGRGVGDGGLGPGE